MLVPSSEVETIQTGPGGKRLSTFAAIADKTPPSCSPSAARMTLE